MTLSIACSKCVSSTLGERYLAAIRAASLQTFAMSAPKQTISQCSKVRNVNTVDNHDEPVKPGVNAAILLPTASIFTSVLSGFK
jgi:hypothetical protein